MDNPTNREKKERLKTLEELMPNYDIKTAGEYISDFTGGIANDIDSFSKLTLSIIIIINILVTFLMVKSFLIKEKKEVALLKSLGFRNKSLLKWQVTRVGIILLISIIIFTVTLIASAVTALGVRGEMVAIMRPSGSGKSTLLYSISGMDQATAGKVMFIGENITKLSEDELADIRLNKMGFIFQQMYMMRNLTIFDNIILPASQSKKFSDKSQAVDYGLELMHKLAINDIADNDITNSHDIKTPLSAIKLYSSALVKDLYKDDKKLRKLFAFL